MTPAADYIAAWQGASPNLHFLQSVLGLLLIALEFCRPGKVWPAALGGLLFVTGAFCLSQQPLSLPALLALPLAALLLLWLSWRGTPALWLLPPAAALCCSAAWLAPGRISLAVSLPATLIWLLTNWWLLSLAGRALRNKTNLN